MTKKQRWAFAGVPVLLAVIGLILGFFLMSGTSAGEPTAILSVIAGEVQLTQGQAPPRPAEDGEQLNSGDRVRTGADGRAVITYFEGTTQTLDPDTEVLLERIAVRDDGGLFGGVQQLAGHTWNNVLKSSDKGADFTVDTPAAAAAVRDTMFRVDVLDDDTTSVWSRQGRVAVSAQGSEVLTAPDTRLFTALGGPPGPPLPVAPSDAEFVLAVESEAWAIVRDGAGLVSGLVPPGAPVNQIPLAVINSQRLDVQSIALTEVSEASYDFYLAYDAGSAYKISIFGSSNGEMVCGDVRDGVVEAGQLLKAQVTLTYEAAALAGCGLTELEPSNDSPYEHVVVPEQLKLAVNQGRELIPEVSVLGATAEPSPTPTSTPTATKTSRSPVAAVQATPSPHVATPLPSSTPVPTATLAPAPTSTNVPSSGATPPPATAVPTASPTSAPPTQTPTITPTPGPCAPSQVDVDGDGFVTTNDQLLVTAAFGQPVGPGTSQYDVNGDGVINTGDIQMVNSYEGFPVCP